MRKILITLAVFCGLCSTGISQVGLSYFFPEKGYFSVPVAPFSYSQPLQFRNFPWIKFTPSAAIYSIGGMSVRGLPEGMESSKPLIGPFHAVTAGFMPSLSIPAGPLDFDFGMGYFGSYAFNPGVIRGNFDDMIARSQNWDACSSKVEMDKKIAHGFTYGFTLTIWLSDDQAIAPGIIYYNGSAPLNLRGRSTGGALHQPVESMDWHFPDSKLNFRGWEFLISIQF
jgi:hypothetical protein